jgi:hypothetical protein
LKTNLAPLRWFGGRCGAGPSHRHPAPQALPAAGWRGELSDVIYAVKEFYIARSMRYRRHPMSPARMADAGGGAKLSKVFGFFFSKKNTC